MNKKNFNIITDYFIQGRISITTYRMLIETFERMHELKNEHQELERMQQGEFNHYYYNAHFITK